jgi:hypothetical protein
VTNNPAAWSLRYACGRSSPLVTGTVLGFRWSSSARAAGSASPDATSRTVRSNVDPAAIPRIVRPVGRPDVRERDDCRIFIGNSKTRVDSEPCHVPVPAEVVAESHKRSPAMFRDGPFGVLRSPMAHISVWDGQPHAPGAARWRFAAGRAGARNPRSSERGLASASSPTVSSMVWNAIAAVASVLAVLAALATVRLTINFRREERLRHLAEALTFVVTTAEDHPGPNGPAPEVAVADALLEEALHHLDRVVALSLLGLSAQVSRPVLELMDLLMRADPQGGIHVRHAGLSAATRRAPGAKAAPDPLA